MEPNEVCRSFSRDGLDLDFVVLFQVKHGLYFLEVSEIPIQVRPHIQQQQLSSAI